MPPRGDQLRLEDIKRAISKIREYTSKGPEWLLERPNETWDAVLWNFAIIGEAVKALSQDTLQLAPEGEWEAAARMRDAVIHRYFANDPSVISSTVENDLPKLQAAVDQALSRIGEN